MNNALRVTAHCAELLTCGCRVDPQTGDVFTACARHACHPVMADAELPRCPFCASRNLTTSTAGLHLVCNACGCRFPVGNNK